MNDQPMTQAEAEALVAKLDDVHADTENDEQARVLLEAMVAIRRLARAAAHPAEDAPECGEINPDTGRACIRPPAHGGHHGSLAPSGKPEPWPAEPAAAHPAEDAPGDKVPELWWSASLAHEEGFGSVPRNGLLMRDDGPSREHHAFLAHESMGWREWTPLAEAADELAAAIDKHLGDTDGATLIDLLPRDDRHYVWDAVSELNHLAEKVHEALPTSSAPAAPPAEGAASGCRWCGDPVQVVHAEGDEHYHHAATLRDATPTPAAEVVTPAGEGGHRWQPDSADDDAHREWACVRCCARLTEGIDPIDSCAPTAPPTEGEEPIYTVDQAWFREVLAAADITSCVSVTPEDMVMHFAGLKKQCVEALRETNGVARNLTRAHEEIDALKAVVTEVAERAGVTVGPLHTPQQIEVLGQQLLAAVRDATPTDGDFTDALAEAYDHGRRDAARTAEADAVGPTRDILDRMIWLLDRRWFSPPSPPVDVLLRHARATRHHAPVAASTAGGAS